MFCKKWIILFLIILIFGVFRKIWLGMNVLNYVKNNSEEVSIERLLSLTNVKATLSSLPNNQSTLIMFLNRHIIQMTINWLCNTQHMEGVHSRTLLITIDKIASKEIAQRWPNLRILEININSLHLPFNYGDGPYHLFTVFRANLASLISSLGKPFWMIQQDTYWRENLLKLDLENINESADILFDRSSPAEANNLIAGGYIFVRPSLRSTQFFAKLATNLLNKYTPDNGLMTSLCSYSSSINCGLIPFCVVTNWLWLQNYVSTTDKNGEKE
uniref:Nucleotide-diphospho-sugar transferase domain-containing protein n=1 Tax=Meloidogyne enterolobii TaxID=390850 RepID=A0A6V7VT00_MELEN|nr:unnamed protein product [Meloidogyne enterolobii]